jgi:hypothetical protein
LRPRRRACCQIVLVPEVDRINARSFDERLG